MIIVVYVLVVADSLKFSTNVKNAIDQMGEEILNRS